MLRYNICLTTGQFETKDVAARSKQKCSSRVDFHECHNCALLALGLIAVAAQEEEERCGLCGTRQEMKKSWLQATIEEPLKRAASAALLPVINDSLENLHLKSLVSKIVQSFASVC